MAKLTLSEAARACNVARTTIQRAVKTGRLSLDAEHRVDTAELLRIGYQLDAAVLHAASQQSSALTQQNAAPKHSTVPQQAAVPQDLQLLRQERDALQRERDLLMQQLTMLHTMHKTTQQQLTQAQQMLHEIPAGVRNKIHTHSSDQVLFVTAGAGISPPRRRRRKSRSVMW